MIFGANVCGRTNIIDWHLIENKDFFMKNKLNILFLSFGLLFGACNTATTTQKTPADNTSAPPANSSKTENNTADSKFPPAPAAVMTANVKLVDGGTVKFENQSGKVLLLNLWATWCGPCRQEMPDLIEMQNKYGDQGFEIVGLNTDDETPEQVKPFVEEMKLNYKIGWANAEMMKEFMGISGVAAIPQSFLIDRNGRLRGAFVGGGSALEKMKVSVEKLMAEKN